MCILRCGVYGDAIRRESFALVMEWVDGDSVCRVRTSGMPVALAVEIGRALAGALAAAVHSAGIVRLHC